MLSKIISGGQTGADIAGIDAAIAHDLEYGGTLPRGRKNEVHQVPIKYDKFIALSRGGYPMRTKQNIKDSDGTVIFYRNNLSGGSKLTSKYVNKYGKFKLLIRVDKYTIETAVSDIVNWIEKNKILVLNVAGSSASRDSKIYAYVFDVISKVIDRSVII